jgi:hypothetical protein
MVWMFFRVVKHITVFYSTELTPTYDKSYK